MARHDEASPPASFEIRRILVLDDDVMLAETLKELLESRNYVVTLARNGVEGLKEIMDLDFDVIICDILMPAMAGDMFYLAVQRAKPQLAPRFVFVTGHSDDPRVNEFLRRAAAPALTKPVDTAELVEAISLVLNQTKHSGSVPAE